MLKVQLFGANGTRTIEVQPLTPPIQTFKPVLPAFQNAWAANKGRIVDFLSEGFNGNISEGSVIHQLGDAITHQYAPRKKMTANQWRALTADLLLDTWQVGHWLHDLKRKIWRKYEDSRRVRLVPKGGK